MFFVFYSYSGIFCMKCLMLSTAVGMVFIWIGWHWRPLLEWFFIWIGWHLRPLLGIFCWLQLFHPTIFYIYVWVWGNFLNLEFSPSEIVRFAIFIGGIFLILKNSPNQLAIYILLLGRKSQRKRNSPISSIHILYIIHRYTKYAT